jgi:hypothetical protein
MSPPGVRVMCTFFLDTKKAALMPPKDGVGDAICTSLD